MGVMKQMVHGARVTLARVNSVLILSVLAGFMGAAAAQETGVQEALGDSQVLQGLFAAVEKEPMDQEAANKVVRLYYKNNSIQLPNDLVQDHYSERVWPILPEVFAKLPQSSAKGKVRLLSLIGSLEEVGSHEHTVYLEKLAEAEAEPGEVRIQSIQLLGSWHPSGSLRVLRKLARDPDPAIRMWVVSALQAYKQDEVRDIFRASLDDDDPGVRVSAARAVIPRYDLAGMDVLIELLEDKTPVYREMAASALEQLTDRQIGRYLLYKGLPEAATRSDMTAYSRSLPEEKRVELRDKWAAVWLQERDIELRKQVISLWKAWWLANKSNAYVVYEGTKVRIRPTTVPK